MSGDRLAEIETWVSNGNFNFAARDDVLALVEIARAARLMRKALLGIAYGKWENLADVEIATLMEDAAVQALEAAEPALARLDSGATEEGT